MGLNGPTLKRNHRHHHQVQGEMAITGLTWCDFVVWTNATHNNLFVERIHFDQQFVACMLPKLKDFYFKSLQH